MSVVNSIVGSIVNIIVQTYRRITCDSTAITVDSSVTVDNG